MTDQQVLIYRTWLSEGAALLVPMPSCPGWCWLVLWQKGREIQVRELSPHDVTRLQPPGERKP
jgi:hypothetical protein